MHVETAEKLILQGVTARDAFQSHFKSYTSFKLRYPQDYRRLMNLAKCVRMVRKGCTIREAAKVAGWSERYFCKKYPELADKCRDSKKYLERKRIAAICEEMVMDPDASLQQIAYRTGETVNMVYKAHSLYYGYII